MSAEKYCPKKPDDVLTYHEYKAREKAKKNRLKKWLAASIIAIGLMEERIVSAEQIPIEGGCTAIVIPFIAANGGITLPLPGGDSVIIYNASTNMYDYTKRHERGHSEQVCRLGAKIFLIEYFKNPSMFECDADRKALVLRPGCDNVPQLREQTIYKSQ